MGANFGIAGLDWQQRVNWERLREVPLGAGARAHEGSRPWRHDLMYDEKVRYFTGTLTPGWNRLKPGLRYAMLCGDDPPVLFEQGDLGFQIERHAPWMPKENVRGSYRLDQGRGRTRFDPAGDKFTNAMLEEMRRWRRRAKAWR